MKFIVEYFTLTGLNQIELEASSYRELELIANLEMEKGSGILGIRCIREIRRVENKLIS
ncbi:hypothetical protein [Effusibacillus consociatus]|uniref:Uncharacterized protein n=1 Tax=Effusibacillus consociatus TaxID=1117041 RepID=A0ABV9Q3I1_9BACL